MSDPELGTGARRGARARLLRYLVFGGVLGVGVALAFWAGFTPRPPPTEDAAPAPAAPDDDIAQLLAVPNPGYVGIDTCAECHAARAATFKTGRHYLACRPAAAGSIGPGFAPAHAAFARPGDGPRFEMTRAGPDHVLTRLTGTDRTTDTLGLVYGSAGQHDEMYFAWRGDRLFHLPMAWLHPHGRWGRAAHAADALPTHPSCLECHNTWVAHVPGTVNEYRRSDMLLGVTCERCHGPGRAHTDHHRANPSAAAHAILHPGTLSRERLIDVCAQCHANAKHLGRPFSYRPGEPLEAHFRNARPSHQEDDTTNQVRYMSASKCFQKSDMTCVTCHDPHRPHRAAAGCAACHQPAACTARPRLPAEVRADCVACHMPSRVWTHAHVYHTADDKYVPLAPRAEHRIGVYPEAAEARVLAWLRTQPGADRRAEAELLAAKVVQFWTNEAARRLDEGRFKAAIGSYREALRIAPSAALRHQLGVAVARQTEFDALNDRLRAAPSAEVATGVLEDMLRLNPRSALAHGELGTILARTGHRDRAVGHLRAVREHEPADSYGVQGLAELAFFEGRTDEAVALCADALRINPASPQTRHLMGLALSRQGRWAAAEEQFRKALAIDPAHVASNDRLSEALRRQGHADEAVRFARRAAHFSRNGDPEVLLTLGNAYIAARRTGEARAALEKALAVAPRDQRGLVEAIRDRLRALD